MKSIRLDVLEYENLFCYARKNPELVDDYTLIGKAIVPSIMHGEWPPNEAGLKHDRDYLLA